MAGALGDLNISLALETAQFTSALEKSAYQLSQSAGQMVSSLASVDAALSRVSHGVEAIAGLVGISISVHAFSELISGSIEAADKLRDLAAYTGSTVEDLSKLKQPADLAGVSMDEVAGMVAKLSKNLLAAQDPASKASAAFGAFGITGADVNRMLHEDAVSALIEVAAKLDGFQGSTAKAAAEQAIFGKGGSTTAAFMSTLAENIGLVVTTTTAQAEAAHAARVAHAELNGAITKLVNEGVSGLIPQLAEITKAFTGFVSNKEATVDVFATLGTALKLAAGAAGVFWTALANTGQAIGLVAALGEISRAAGGGAAGFAAQKEAFAGFMLDVQGRQTQLVDFWTNLNFEGKAHTAAAEAAHGHKGAIGDLGGQLKTTTDDAVKWFNSIVAATAALENGELETMRLKGVQAGLSADLAGTMVNAWNDARNAVDREKTALEAVSKAYETDSQAVAKEAAAQNDLNAKIVTQTGSLNAAIVAINNQAAAMASGDPDRTRMLQQLNTLNATGGITVEQFNSMKASINAAFDNKQAVIAGIQQAQDYQAAWQSTSDTIEHALENAFFDALKKGKNLFQDLLTAVESMFAKLVLRPILEPIAGGLASFVTGVPSAYNGSPGGGLQSMFGGMSNPFGSGFSLGNNTWGGGMGPPAPDGSMSMTYWDMAGQALGGAAAGYFAGTIGNQLFGNSKNQQGMQIGGAVGGAIGSIFGPVGTIVGSIAGSALGSLFKSGGGAKQGGAYSDISGFNLYPGETSTANNTSLQQVVTANTAGYNAMISALHGTGTAQFGLSYDTDPQGNAQNRVSAGATVNGRSVYSVLDQGIGRDDATLQARLGLEAKRSLLAALQASEFPTDIAKIFNSVNVVTAGGDTIDKVLAYASAVGSVNDALAHIGTIGSDLAKLSKATVVDAFNAQGDALQGLMDNFDGSVSQTNALNAATQSYYNSLVALIAQIQQVEKAVDAMFGSSSQTVFLSGRSNAFLTSYYQQQQSSALGSLGSLNDPNAIQNAGKTLNDSIMAMWQMLSPEDQAKQRDWFLQMLADGQKAVDARLEKIGKDATDKATTQYNQLHDLLMLAAGKIDTAADKNVSAADNQITAANTPTAVDIHFTANVPGTTDVQVFASPG